MKRIIIATGAALLAAVPATLGLVGNTSFAQSVPVRVPQQASVLDDSGRLTPHVEPGDDNGGQRSTSATEPGDDNGGQRSTGDSRAATDDKGRLTTLVEPGDNTVSDSSAATDDNAGHGGDTGGTDASGTGSKDDGSGHS